MPVCVLLVAAEIVARFAGLDDPTLETIALPEEKVGLNRSDPDLFWSMKPNVSIEYGWATVTTNSLGLRAPEIGAKAENEYRILSMGESTTFGMEAANHQTYTDRLGALLQEKLPDKKVVAINAGVSAYSSFQSLKYFELRGLKLKPDLVLFYHEVNDYLPSSMRNSGHTEIGVMKTDKQLYESRVHGLHRRLLETSALFRWLNNTMAYRKVQAFNKQAFRNPVLDVGLPDLDVPRRLRIAGGDNKPHTQLNEMSLGRRVSDAERLEVLSTLAMICANEKIDLVVIHPAYRSTTPHECLLTRFCRENDVTMFDAFAPMHPRGVRPLYIDAIHPSREGHKQLAIGLADFLMENVLKDP